MRIIITGGNGLIGRELAAELMKAGNEVIVLSRNPERARNLPTGVQVAGWDGRSAQGWGKLADGARAIINLAGSSIAGESLLKMRWSAEGKKDIMESRRNAGKAVAEAVQAAEVKPQVVVQVSGVGYYGLLDERAYAEDDPQGTDYLAQVCGVWEQGTKPVEAMGVRRVVFRTAPVLSEKSVVLGRQMLPFKLFVGGPIGNGRQPYAWVHMADVVGAYRFAIENEEMHGTYNLAGLEQVTNARFGQALGKVMGRPYYLPAPAIAFKLAFGEVSVVLLTGQRLAMRKIQEAGYVFKFPNLEAALRECVKK